MKVKQLSRELDISRTSNKVSHFPFGPGPLDDLCGQAELPSHSPFDFILFAWAREVYLGKVYPCQNKPQNIIFVHFSRRKQNITTQTRAKAGQNILHEFPISQRAGLRNYNNEAPRINYFSSSV